MLVFKKWLIPIELLNLMLCGLIIAGLLWPKSNSGALAWGAGRDYPVLEAYLQAEMGRDGVPGLWLGIVSQGKIIYQKGFGSETAFILKPAENDWLLNFDSYVKNGILRSRTGDFYWQWGVKDSYGMMKITPEGSETGFILVLLRSAGIKQAGKLAVKTVNEYWGSDLDPEAFNAVEF
ncbi:MAG: hypothetical protein K6U80_07175 [Firmicutes bacterium]|nr:hypothetical protein [Bacillota bacterium]